MDCPKRTFKHVLVDNGLVSLIDMETGVSSISMNNNHNHHLYHFVSRPSLKNISWVSSSSSVSTSSSSSRSPRSTVGPFIVSGGFVEKPKESHFLDYCFLCKKQIGVNKDIFMYRGDTPFCSEECRQEQIEMDEAEEKSRNLSASVKAMRKREQKKSNSSSTKTNQNCSFHSSRMMLLPEAKKPIIF